MKRTLFALTMLIGCGATFQMARADVSVDFFYNNLSGGSWIEVADYGYCWQPDVAVGHGDWRPYADGYWAYTNVGWTWVSYEDFGWATYHYGRWARLADLGWVWVPGRDEDLEWGPAWVSWRTGDEYIGWAPLPPSREPIYEGGAITGHVDIVFDIGPAYYNFVDIRYIGEPVLRERIFAPTQNVTYINQTINVTNITYRNKTVYNYGPDVNVVNQRASRPIQRLTIQHENNVDYANVAKSGGLKTRVQGQSLVVAAPTHIAKPARQMSPPAVKTKIAKANLDTGWSALGDAKAKEEFKQKLQAEDLSKAGRPDRGAEQAAAANSPAGNSVSNDARIGSSPPAGASGSAGTEAGKQATGGKRDFNKARDSVQQNAPAEAATPAGAVGAAQGPTDSQFNRARGGKGRNRQDESNAAGAQSPATIPPNENTGGGADISGQQGFHEKGRRVDQNRAYPPADPDVTGLNQPRDPALERATRQRAGELKPAGSRFEQAPQQGAVSPNGATNPNAQGQGRGEDKHRAIGQGAVEGQQQGQGHHGGKQGRAPEATPVPSP